MQPVCAVQICLPNVDGSWVVLSPNKLSLKLEGLLASGLIRVASRLSSCSPALVLASAYRHTLQLYSRTDNTAQDFAYIGATCAVSQAIAHSCSPQLVQGSVDHMLVVYRIQSKLSSHRPACISDSACRQQLDMV